MRFYDSLGYLNNNNNNNSNNYNSLNGNVSGNTVKTFTSNGNHHQSNRGTADVTTGKATATLDQRYFAPFYHDQEISIKTTDSTDLCDALTAINSETCFYGLNRKLKPREDITGTNVAENVIDAEDNDINSNECRTVDFDEADVEADINHMINRGNSFRRDFVENRSFAKENGGSTHFNNNFLDDDDGSYKNKLKRFCSL